MKKGKWIRGLWSRKTLRDWSFVMLEEADDLDTFGQI